MRIDSHESTASGTVPNASSSLRITWIDSDDSLRHWVELWMREPVLGVDTEFERTHTYFPRAGLFQIASSHGEALLDPTAIGDWDGFRELMLAPQVCKILHACSEDLELFNRVLGALPQPLFDTQIAAAFNGMGLSVGYQRLVEAELGVSLPASETRSDWLKRPLSPSQIEYAAADVHHLLPLYRRQVDELQNKQLLQATLDECQALVRDFNEARDPAQYYLKLRGAWRLNRCKQTALQQLCLWREKQARERDVPRSQVISDVQLQDIAHAFPNSLQELSRVSSLNPRLIKREGDALIQILRESRNLGSAALTATIPHPLAKNRKELFQRLRDCLHGITEATSIPEPLLCRKAQLEQLAQLVDLRQPLSTLPISFSGWREELVATALLDVINQFIAEHHVENSDLHLQKPQA